MVPIITFVTLGLLLIDTFGLYLLSSYEEGGKISSIFKARRIAKVVALFELNLLNMLFVFLPIRLIIDFIIVLLVNIVTIGYFVWDLLFLSERKKEYVLWLQQIVFSQSKLDSVFYIKEDDGGKYQEEKKFNQQRCSIVKQANEKYESIKLEYAGKTYYLVPKKELTIETLTFYCLKIDFDLDKKEKLCVYSENVDPVAIKEYENDNLSKPYMFIKTTLFSSGCKIVFTIIIIFMMIGISVAAIISTNLGYEPFDWLFLEF